jgi:group I intron endonuclease
MGFIYKITNKINNKIYIGQTRLSLEERWKAHIKKAQQYPNRYLYDAMNHYGYENFIIEKIEECLNDELDLREQYWISFYNSTDPDIGYNLTNGGGGGNTWSLNQHKDITSEKIRKAQLKDNYIPITKESLLEDIENKITLEKMCQKYHCKRTTINSRAILYFGQPISKLRTVENTGQFHKKEIDQETFYQDIIENKLNITKLTQKYNLSFNTLNNKSKELFGDTVMNLRKGKWVVKNISDEKLLNKEILLGKTLKEIAAIFNMSANTLVARLKEKYNMNFKEYREYVKSKN